MAHHFQSVEREDLVVFEDPFGLQWVAGVVVGVYQHSGIAAYRYEDHYAGCKQTHSPEIISFDCRIYKVNVS